MIKKHNRNTDDSAAIRKYIAEHGFGPKIQALIKSLSADEFKQHYYDSKELRDFCRSVGISTSGLKTDLNSRIELYLRTGKITKLQSGKKPSKPDSESGLSLDKRVVNYKSDLDTRRFFSQHISEFTGFSALVQKQIKQRLADGEAFTYGDAIEMHKAYLKDKKSAKSAGESSKVAHDSCQFNQFYIDFSHDPNDKVHSAKEAWILVRESAGEKTYQWYKDKIEEIRKILNEKSC